MLAALASALAARDPATAAHCTRVTILASRLAMWLEWDESQLRTLALGAPIHDIGKVMISEAVLRKRGPLEEHELAEIRAHPAAGARLVSPVGPVSEVLPYVLYHHEWWDGGGYPTGRVGTDIPEGARLLAVADAFDAMTTMRPYRWPLPTERALDEIERCAGSQFDPTFAAEFLEAWDCGSLRAAEVV